MICFAPLLFTIHKSLVLPIHQSTDVKLERRYFVYIKRLTNWVSLYGIMEELLIPCHAIWEMIQAVIYTNQDHAINENSRLQREVLLIAFILWH